MKKIIPDDVASYINMTCDNEERKKRVAEQRIKNIRENYKKSSDNANKKFDWTTKSYKNS